MSTDLFLLHRLLRKSYMMGRTPMTLAFLFQTTFLIGILTVTGCSSKLSAVSATGTVMHKGKPLEGASVMLGRGGRDITKGELAIGKTDADGRFALTTYVGPQEELKGAVVGKYDVTISKYIIPPGMTEAQYKALVAKVDAISASGAMMPPDQQLPDLVEMLPAKYSAIGKSELSADVTAQGPNVFQFDLN